MISRSGKSNGALSAAGASTLQPSRSVSHHDFEEQRARLFAAEQGRGNIRVTGLNSETGYYANLRPGGGFVDETLNGCAIIGVMLSSLFFCGLLNVANADDVVKFYCANTLRVSRHEDLKRTGRSLDDAYYFIPVDAAHSKAIEMKIHDVRTFAR
jgi:hypothetical protein